MRATSDTTTAMMAVRGDGDGVGVGPEEEEDGRGTADDELDVGGVGTAV